MPNSTVTDPQNPFSKELNAVVLNIARRLFPNGFDTTDNADEAPRSLAELRAHVKMTGRMLVWSGASDDTVFGDAKIASVNHAFRAWHDSVHLAIEAEFSLHGEIRVARAMVKQVRAAGGVELANAIKPLIYEEVVGQALYYELKGSFPESQHSFAQGFLSAFDCPPSRSLSPGGDRG